MHLRGSVSVDVAHCFTCVWEHFNEHVLTTAACCCCCWRLLGQEQQWAAREEKGSGRRHVSQISSACCLWNGCLLEPVRAVRVRVEQGEVVVSLKPVSSANTLSSYGSPSLLCVFDIFQDLRTSVCFHMDNCWILTFSVILYDGRLTWGQTETLFCCFLWKLRAHWGFVFLAWFVDGCITTM